MSDEPVNPYQQPPVEGVENQDDTQIVIVDSRNGTQTLTGRVTETVTVDALGSRTFHRTTAVLRTTDGHLIRDPASQGLFACTKCKADRLGVKAICVCIACQHVLCRRCAKSRRGLWWCRPCYWRHRARELFREIFRCP